MKKEWKLLTAVLSILLAVTVIITGFPIVQGQPVSKKLPAAKSFSQLKNINTAKNTKVKDFSLGTMADLHYYPECLTGDKERPLYTLLEGSNAIYDDMDAMLDAAFESAAYEAKYNGVKNFVLIGDLTTNGEIEGHRAVAAKLKKFEEETGANVWITLGNHDINNGGASTFSSDEHRNQIVQGTNRTTPQQFVDIYKDFGFNQYYHKMKSDKDGGFYAGNHGALTYSVKLAEDGIRLLMVDGGVYSKDCTKSGKDGNEINGFFSEEQLKWIKAEAAEAKKDGEIPLLFTHWNMSEMNYMHEKVLQGFVMDDAYKVQEELTDAGIHYAFSGHQHVTDLDITYSDSGEPMYSVITPTLTQFPFAYRVTKFHRNSDNTLDVTFDQHDIDAYSQVKNYEKPYSRTGFGKLYGYTETAKPDAAEYAMKLIKRSIGYILDDIDRRGSVLEFLKASKGIDVKKKIEEILPAGIGAGVSGNVMLFLNDLDSQIVKNYFGENLPGLYDKAAAAIAGICNLQIPEVSAPCTKFIEKLNFGDASKPGTFGDVVLSCLAYLYSGNEDISDDKFMQEFLEYCAKPEFSDFVLNALRKYIVNDILIEDLFRNVIVHLNAFFAKDPLGTGKCIQAFVEFAASVLGSEIFSARDAQQITEAIKDCSVRMKEHLTIKNLLDAILATGLMKFGNDTDSLIDALLERFLPDDFRTGLAYEAEHVIGSMVHDDEKDFGPDVTYRYSGPEKVVPSKDDMQIPAGITLAPGKDGSTSFTATWFTKYSVTGTDIEIHKKGEGLFTGKPTKTNIKASTATVEYTHPGFDAGVFGILPWKEDVIKHSVTVTGLTPGTEYEFRIGDASKDFWEDGSVKTAPAADGKFTFIHVSDSDGFIPSHFENLDRTLDAAKLNFPEAQMIVHTGGLIEVSGNDKQWNWATEANAEHFTSMPILYASGEKDADGLSSVAKHMSEENLPEQNKENGLYYSCDYGNVHFIVINTNSLRKGGELDAQQTGWLKQDLAGSRAKWNILVMNKSIYGSSFNVRLKHQLLRIMEQYKIDIILQGSENIYVRTKLLKNNVPVECISKKEEITANGTEYTAYEDSCGTIAVISGSAGRYLNDTAQKNYFMKKAKGYGMNMFSAVTADGGTLTLDAYTVDENGVSKRVDSFALER